MAMGANPGGKSKAVVRFAEARIIGPAQQLINRRTVTIGGPEVTERIEHQPKGIYLAPTVLLDMGAVDFEPITVPGIHLDGAAILCHQGRVIVVSVVGIDPAVETTPEGARQTVDVLFESESAENPLLLVRVSISIGVLKKVNIGNAEGDHPVLVRV